MDPTPPSPRRRFLTTHPEPHPGSAWVADTLRVALAMGPNTGDCPTATDNLPPVPDVPTDREWPTVLAAAKRHRVVPVVSDLARTIGLTDNQVADLHAAHRTAAGLALLVVATTRQVTAALTDAGIRCLVVKGAVLALAQGRSVANRGGGDVDVWVHPGDTARAVDVLQHQGWRPAINHELVGDTVRARVGRLVVQEVGLTHPKQPPVDLHWRLARIGGQLPVTFDRAWERSVPVAAPMAGARTLSPNDTLLHVCTHATSDAFPTLRQVFDVAALVTTLLPGQVAELARTNTSVAVAVSVASNLDPHLGALVPNRRRVQRLARWGWAETMASRLRHVDRINDDQPGVADLRLTLLGWQLATARTPLAAAGVLADPVLARTVLR